MPTPLPLEDHLTALGLSPADDLGFVDEVPGAHPGRVVVLHGSQAEVTWVEGGQARTELLGLASSLNLVPVAGDWVAVRRGEVARVGERRTALTRPDPNGKDTQVLAANVDTVLIAMPIDRSVNLKALERLQVMAWDSGATPVVVLTKADESDDVDAAVAEVESVAAGVPILVTSAVDGRGLDDLRSYLGPTTTSTMLGASGVGKTSLLNALEGTEEATLEVRGDGQGRHTTTTRKLHPTSSGGVLLDVPGIRSLGLLATQDGVSETFADITLLAESCRFTDCAHDGDAGCAVEAAVADEELPARRLESWRAIQRELAYQRRRTDPRAMAEARQEWKRMSKGIRDR